MSGLPPPTPENLSGLDVFEKAAAAGELPTLLASLTRAAAEGGPGAEVMALLARALRTDLAFLVEHPREVFSCLYNRCRFHGRRGGAAFFERTPDTSSPSRASPVADLLAAWETERGPSAAPWVQSLRPPEFAVDGPLLEEYRADLRLPFAVRLTFDGRVTVRHQGPRAQLAMRSTAAGGPNCEIGRVIDSWDRATGRRLAPLTVFDVPPTGGVHVSADGRLRAERHDAGRRVTLVSARDRSVLAVLAMESAPVWTVAFFTDTSRVVLGGHADDVRDGFAGRLTIVDVARGRAIARLKTRGRPYYLAISPDGRRIAAAARREVVVWDWEAGDIVAEIATDAYAIGFGGDGQTLVTATETAVRVWDVRPGVRATGLPGTRDPLCRAQFSPNGNRLVTGQWLCDSRSGAPIAHLGHASGAYLEGGPTRPPLRVFDNVVVCLERGIRLWDAGTGSPLPRRDRGELFNHRQIVAICADGSRYAVTTSTLPHEPRPAPAPVRVLNLVEGQVQAQFIIPMASSIALSDDGLRLVSGSPDGVARVWDATSGELITSFTGHAPDRNVSGVAFLIGGESVASGAEDDSLCVWDSRNGAEQLRRPLRPGDPQSRDGEHRHWRASTGAVAEVEAWAGLRRPRRWEAESAAGAIRIVDRDRGETIAWLAAGDAGTSIAAHPDAPIWASGPLHFRLAGVED